MKNCKEFLILILFFISITACQNPKKTQEGLHKEVMAVHDSLMMDMGKLSDRKSKLSAILTQLDSLKIAQPSLNTTALKNTIFGAKLSLTKADEVMMDWMNDFNPDYTKKTELEVEIYLRDEKVKIEKVKTLFKNSLFTSDSLITKYQ
jgi:hypothetical protein